MTRQEAIDAYCDRTGSDKREVMVAVLTLIPYEAVVEAIGKLELLYPDGWLTAAHARIAAEVPA